MTSAKDSISSMTFFDQKHDRFSMFFYYLIINLRSQSSLSIYLLFNNCEVDLNTKWSLKKYKD